MEETNTTHLFGYHRTRRFSRNPADGDPSRNCLSRERGSTRSRADSELKTHTRFFLSTSEGQRSLTSPETSQQQPSKALWGRCTGAHFRDRPAGLPRFYERLLHASSTAIPLQSFRIANEIGPRLQDPAQSEGILRVVHLAEYDEDNSNPPPSGRCFKWFCC